MKDDNELIAEAYKTQVIQEAVKMPARLLQKGDQLVLTNAVVSGVWTKGLNVPVGKVVVQYQDKRGDLKTAVWNQQTEILVNRPVAQ